MQLHQPCSNVSLTMHQTCALILTRSVDARLGVLPLTIFLPLLDRNKGPHEICLSKSLLFLRLSDEVMSKHLLGAARKLAGK